MHEITSHQVGLAKFDDVPCVKGFDRISKGFPAYLSDESGFSTDPFDYLFFPRGEAELAAVLREMGRKGITVTVAGARTGLVGGCVPMGGALVSLEHFHRVTDVYYAEQADEWRIRTQAAVSLKELNRMAMRKRFGGLERSGDRSARMALTRFRDDLHTYFYPPDPTETTASIGGTVATNASGARTYRYGPTRAWVRGIRVMLVNGEVLDIQRGTYFASPGGEFVIYDSTGGACSVNVPDYTLPRTKNTAGFFAAPQMDPVDMFVGSEGAFGIIVAADVALRRYRRRICVVQFVSSDDPAIALAETLRADTRLRLDCLEFFSERALALLRIRQKQDPRSLGIQPIPADAGAAILMELVTNPFARSKELETLEKVVESCGANPDHSWAGYTPRELGRLKTFRHLFPQTMNEIIAERKSEFPGLHKVATDLAVPNEHLRDMWEVYVSALDEAGLEWAAFGHIGNSHLHVNILPRNMHDLERGLEFLSSFARTAVRFGGTISAEHGIGKIKSRSLSSMFSQEQIDQMRAVKQAFDPNGLLNPGNIFG